MTLLLPSTRTRQTRPSMVLFHGSHARTYYIIASHDSAKPAFIRTCVRVLLFHLMRWWKLRIISQKLLNNVFIYSFQLRKGSTLSIYWPILLLNQSLSHKGENGYSFFNNYVGLWEKSNLKAAIGSYLEVESLEGYLSRSSALYEHTFFIGLFHSYYERNSN